MTDKTATVQKLKDLVQKFSKERNWDKHHTPRNLAVSIAIEAAELMEHFQWDDSREKNTAELEGELADIVSYCLYFAVANKIDIAKAIEKKLDKVSKKYPVEMFNHETDDRKEYWRIKKNYRNKK